MPLSVAVSEIDSPDGPLVDRATTALRRGAWIAAICRTSQSGNRGGQRRPAAAAPAPRAATAPRAAAPPASTESERWKANARSRCAGNRSSSRTRLDRTRAAFAPLKDSVPLCPTNTSAAQTWRKPASDRAGTDRHPRNSRGHRRVRAAPSCPASPPSRRGRSRHRSACRYEARNWPPGPTGRAGRCRRARASDWPRNRRGTLVSSPLFESGVAVPIAASAMDGRRQPLDRTGRHHRVGIEQQHILARLPRRQCPVDAAREAEIDRVRSSVNSPACARSPSIGAMAGSGAASSTTTTRSRYAPHEPRPGCRGRLPSVAADRHAPAPRSAATSRLARRTGQGFGGCALGAVQDRRDRDMAHRGDGPQGQRLAMGRPGQGERRAEREGAGPRSACRRPPDRNAARRRWPGSSAVPRRASADGAVRRQSSAAAWMIRATPSAAIAARA